MTKIIQVRKIGLVNCGITIPKDVEKKLNIKKGYYLTDFTINNNNEIIIKLKNVEEKNK